MVDAEGEVRTTAWRFATHGKNGRAMGVIDDPGFARWAQNLEQQLKKMEAAQNTKLAAVVGILASLPGAADINPEYALARAQSLLGTVGRDHAGIRQLIAQVIELAKGHNRAVK